MKTPRILFAVALIAALIPQPALGVVSPDAFEDDDSRLEARTVASSNLPLEETQDHRFHGYVNRLGRLPGERIDRNALHLRDDRIRRHHPRDLE